MSMSRLVFPSLCWSELEKILSYLTLHELYILGHCNRSAFITFTREKPLRNLQSHLINEARFLSKYSGHDKILLVSYPRSGNSFLRKLLEVETAIITGSDSRPNRTLSASLLQCGYRGEGIVDNSVWVVKSHFPERLGYVKFNVSRVVLVVRNPFDAIESYFHMGMTNTHDRMLTPEAFQELKDKYFTPCVINEANIWTQFHDYWKRQSATVPVLLVRYEDMLTNEKDVMKEVINFMCEVPVPCGLKRFMKTGGTSVGSALSSVGESSQSSRSVTPLAGCASSSSEFPSPSAATTAGPGYRPKKKKVGKALRHGVMGPVEVMSIVRAASVIKKEFGYNLEVATDQADGLFRLNVTPLTNEQGETVYAKRLAPPQDPPTPSSPGGSSVVAPPAVPSTVMLAGGFRVNENYSVRPPSDQYGRLFTVLRRGITADDTKPFPMV